MVVAEGTCWVLLAFDVGQAIDLDAAEKALRRSAAPAGPGESATAGNPIGGFAREVFRHERRGPAHLQVRPAPLRVDQHCTPIALGAFETQPQVEVTLLDFGAVSVAYRVPIRGPLDGLLPLATELYENPRLVADARARVGALVTRLGAAVARPGQSDLVEDYVVYQVRRQETPTGQTAAEAVAANGRSIAQVLRAEAAPLSEGEVADALGARISYGERDAAVVDWNAALLLDDQADDVMAVLEFVNIELLELRLLDDRLDATLDRSYADVARRAEVGGGFSGFLGRGAEERRRVAGLQVESALLFESVNNALKLLGDQYLARVYRLAAQRFHLADWDASIQRKLATLESLYEKLTDDQATRRMEVLEWIIIVLILVSIVLPFVVPGAK